MNTLQLRDGPARLDGAGELALAGERAFRLQATLRQLNPARWSPQLDAGQLNAAVSVQGAAQPLRVQGELTLADSQYRDQRRLALARPVGRPARTWPELDAQLGGNQLHADGRAGRRARQPALYPGRPGWNSWAAALPASCKARASYWARAGGCAANGELRARQLRAPGGVSVDSQ